MKDELGGNEFSESVVGENGRNEYKLILRQGFFKGCNPSKNPSNPIQPPLNFRLTDH
jgi:hypothetical protein